MAVKCGMDVTLLRNYHRLLGVDSSVQMWPLIGQ